MMRRQSKAHGFLFWSPWAVFPAAIFMSITLSACGTHRISQQMLVAGSADLKSKGVQSIGVVEFDGPGDSGKKVADAFTAQLATTQYYKIVGRSQEKLRALDNELALGQMGVVDEKMAAKAGKILGVDAMLMGKVNDWSASDEPYSVTVMQQRATGKTQTSCNAQGQCFQMPVYEEIPTKVNHHKRHITVTISYSVVKTESGEVLASGQKTGNYKFDTGNPKVISVWSGEREKEQGVEEVRAWFTRKIVEDLANGIQPHPVRVDYALETGGMFLSDSTIAQGIKLIEANRVDDAAQHYEDIVRTNPKNNAAYYNLGIAYEIMGNYDKAEQAYRSAEKISANDRYFQAVGRVKQLKEQRKKSSSAAQ